MGRQKTRYRRKMAMERMNRRDFLKMMGAGAAALAFGSIIGFGSDGRPAAREVKAQSGSPWTQGYLTDIAPIHAVLLPNGNILAIAGSGYHTETMNGPFMAQVIEPDSGRAVSYQMDEDLFCCGHNHLADGNVLITGGQLQYDVANSEGNFLGLDAVYIYNMFTNRFVKMPNMPHGRWYPTNVILPDGRVWILDGLDEYGGRNALVEIFDPTSNSTVIQYRPDSNETYTPGAGSSLPGAGSQTYGGPGQGVSPFTSLYPRVYLMPSGLLAIVGMSSTVYLVNPGPGTIAGLAEGVWVNAGNTTPSWRDYGVSFLLPLNNSEGERGKVMIAGGSVAWNEPATNTTRIIDFETGTNTAPEIRNVAPMNIGRTFGMPVILPDGQCAVFGGVTQFANDHVHAAESFNPVTESWSELPKAHVSRSYHSTALLLADGRVWISSGTPNRASWEHRVEFYNPPYYFASDRPVISGRVITAPYGGTIRIPTSNSVIRASLVRLGAHTHHYDPNMRLVWLAVTGAYSGGVEVAAPINARIAPPGPYMLHILNSQNIPSRAQIIQVGVA